MVPFVLQASILDPGNVKTHKQIGLEKFCNYVEWSGNPGDLKEKWPNLCAVNNPQGDTAVQEYEAELETSTRAVVNFQNDMSVFQSSKNLNRRDWIQVLSRGCEINFCWESTGVLEVSESSTSKSDCAQVPDNGPSVVSVVQSRSELQARPEKNFSRVEDAWPKWRRDCPGAGEWYWAQIGRPIEHDLVNYPILIGNLSVLTGHHNWRTAENSLVEKNLSALEQFFMKSRCGGGATIFGNWCVPCDHNRGVGLSVFHWQWAGNSLKYPNVFHRMTSDRVEDGYADPQLNTGVEGTEQFQRINEEDIRHSNVWMF